MRLSTAKIQNAAAQKKTIRLFDGRGQKRLPHAKETSPAFSDSHS
jgi:hypothetical protein